MKTWLIPGFAVIVLLVIIAAMAGAFRDKIEPGLQEIPREQVTDTIAVLHERVPAIEPVPASIGARQATTISSRTLARITRVNVRAGDSVSKGDLLIELERSDVESRLRQAGQKVVAVQARLREARQSLVRAEQLYQQRLVAAASLDEARANHDSLAAELANAEQLVKEAEVALSFTEIRSPIDGRVVERFAEPGDTASPGSKLLSLYNPLSLRIEAPVREKLALPLELGQMLEVEIPALGRTLVARIEELVPAADPGSRSFIVKAQVDFADELLPGMYARLLVPAGEEDVLMVPVDRVVNYGQLDIVWVVRDGRIDRRFIRTGREIRPGWLEVVSGLEENELIMPAR